MLDVKDVEFNLTQDPVNPDAIRGQVFVRILEQILSHEPGKTLVDLGAGHCLFSIKARDHGYKVTAVDARTTRQPDADTLGDIKFVQSDIRDFNTSGYDVVSNLGLFYHLTIDDQIDILRRCSSNPYTILETQVHNPEMPARADCNERLGDLTTEGRYTGIHVTEVQNPMASFGNPTSFWHTEESLLLLFGDTGYKEVIRVSPCFMSKYGMRRYYVLVGKG